MINIPPLPAGAEELREHFPLPGSNTKQSAEAILSEKLSTRLEREFAGVATVQALPSPENQKQQEILQISVINRERWRSPECQRKFLPIIGSILQQTFDPDHADVTLSPDELVAEYKDCDPDFMDNMIIVTQNQQVRGFIMSKHCKPTQTDQVPVVALQLTSVEAGSKYQGTGKQLYKLLYDQNPGAAIVAATHTPAAIQSKAKSLQGDRRLYFCGLRDGDEAKNLSKKELRIVQEAEAQYRDMLDKEYGDDPLVDQSGIPPHCITYGEGSIAWTDEHQWREGDTSPMAQSFSKLRKWVFDHGKEGEGLYGMLTSLPEKALREE
jgi:hypothetical protein